MIKRISALFFALFVFSACVFSVSADGITAQLSRELVNLYPGQSFQLTLTDNDTKQYYYTSANQSVADISPSGLISARNTGITEITCHLSDGKELKCTVNVKEGKSPELIRLDKQMITLTKGESSQLSAQVLPEETADYINFSSSDETIVSVDQEGNIQALNAGAAVITVESESTAVSAGCFVRVLSEKNDSKFSTDVKGVLYNASGEKLINTPLTISNDEFSQKVTTDKNGQFQFTDISGGNYVFTVFSSDTDENGISSNISVNTENIRLSCILTDSGVAVLYGSNISSGKSLREIKLSQKNIKLNTGDTFDISCTLSPADAEIGELIYKSENTEIADVDESGRITALNEGGTVIHVTSSDGRIKEKMTVNVTRYGI